VLAIVAEGVPLTLVNVKLLLAVTVATTCAPLTCVAALGPVVQVLIMYEHFDYP
jgi:hypothetical protein